MIRIAFIFLLAVGVFVALRLVLANKSVTDRQFTAIYIASLGGIALLFLGLTGRLHWLFAVAGAALPFVVRSISVIMRVLSLGRLLQYFRQAKTWGQPHSTGQKSALNTRFFQVELDHDSGNMDGTVLEGPFNGKRLSSLTIEQLISLLDLAQQDPDSESVLRAYMDRTHPDWASQYGGHEQRAGAGPDGNLSVGEAYEILGLEKNATTKQVREAHRRLMQKLHPDHGGSTYLAARINEAKSVLLKHLEGKADD